MGRDGKLSKYYRCVERVEEVVMRMSEREERGVGGMTIVLYFYF